MAEGHPITAHETSDVSIRPIVLTGLLLALAAGIVLAFTVGVFHYFAATVPQAPPNPMAQQPLPQPPAPRVEEHPAIELQQLRQQEDQILNTYGWADKKSGKVRIPLDRAMELQLQRGFPTRKEGGKQ